jgi:hypothetical protein
MGMAGASPVKWNNLRLRNMCMAAGNLFRSWLGAWGSGSSGAERGRPARRGDGCFDYLAVNPDLMRLLQWETLTYGDNTVPGEAR